AKIVQSPRSTIALVPLIGASRKPSPAEAVASPRRLVRVGEIVLIWITVAVRRRLCTRPPVPRITLSTVSRDGRIVKAASAPDTASRGLEAGLRPRGTSALS